MKGKQAFREKVVFKPEVTVVTTGDKRTSLIKSETLRTHARTHAHSRTHTHSLTHTHTHTHTHATLSLIHI